MQKTPSQKKINTFLNIINPNAITRQKTCLYFYKGFSQLLFWLESTWGGSKKNRKNIRSLGRKSKALQINPQDVEVYFNLANTLKDLNRKDEAVINYKKAINIKPDYMRFTII